MEDEKRHLVSLERKISRSSMSASSDAEDISEDLDVSYVIDVLMLSICPSVCCPHLVYLWVNVWTLYCNWVMLSLGVFMPPA